MTPHPTRITLGNSIAFLVFPSLYYTALCTHISTHIIRNHTYYTAAMIQIASLTALIFQLCLASLAIGAPVGDELAATGHGNSWQYGTGGGIIGLVVLILDIIVFSK